LVSPVANEADTALTHRRLDRLARGIQCGNGARVGEEKHFVADSLARNSHLFEHARQHGILIERRREQQFDLGIVVERHENSTLSGGSK